ncbi:MAG: ABC transporter permease [bacterium]
MRLRRFLRLLLSQLRHRSRIFAVTALGLWVALTLFFLVIGLLRGIGFEFLSRFESTFPEREVTVKPRSLDLAFLRFTPPSLTQDQLDRIRALPGVESVAGLLPITFPISATGQILGNQLTTDIVAAGIDPEYVASSIAPGRRFAYTPGRGEAVPVVISEYFLDLYNMGIAEANHLPKLSRSAAVGRSFTLHLGASTLSDYNDAKTSDVVGIIVGFTRQPGLLGIQMPLDAAKSFVQWYEGAPPQHYTAAFVRLKSLEYYEDTIKKIEDLGLSAEGNYELVRRVRLAVTLVSALLLLLVILVGVMAFTNLWSALALVLVEQQSELGIMRAFGATRSQLFRLFFGEVAPLALAGGGMAVLTVLALQKAAEAALTKWLPPTIFLPEKVLALSPPILAGAVIGFFFVCWILVIPLLLGHLRKTPLALLRS